jgi:hypothetical protein
MPAAEIVSDQPDHKHLQIGPLQFCYRNQRDKGWRYEGATVTEVGHVVTAATWGEAFVIAREAMERIVVGAPPVGPGSRCPDCSETFAEAPIGPPPHEWICGPVHQAWSSAGDVTQWTAGEPVETRAHTNVAEPGDG